MTSRFENAQLNQCGRFKTTSRFTGRFIGTLLKGDPLISFSKVNAPSVNPMAQNFSCS